MNFNKMNEMLQKHFDTITVGVEKLFTVEVDKDEMWNLYLDSFDAQYNPIFRERRVHDCSCCRQFIKAMGNVVVIKNSVLTTIWDLTIISDEFTPVFEIMSNYIKSKEINGVFLINEKFTNKSDLPNNRRIGTPENFEQLENGSVKKWEHYALNVPSKFVHSGHDTVGTVRGNLNAIKQVFKRSLDELTKDSVETVLELVYSNTLYKGAEWKQQLELFLQHKNAYEALETEYEKNLYAWEQSVIVGGVIGKIRNHSIGTLLIDLSGRTKEDGEVVRPIELDVAVRKYEAVVAPHNYKRPKAIFTKKMLEDAKDTITQLGYLQSLGRRYSVIDDITINNVLFANRDSVSKLNGIDVFDEMSNEIAVNPKNFSKVEEISIEKFLSDVLPHVNELEVLLENRHQNNMVSLIAPKDINSKTMFKWDNNFSWAYSGNITDSSMKENVKSAGGRVDGDLRFSIQWNEEGQDITDLDAHCQEPTGGTHIFYRSKNSRRTGGVLDVDIQRPHGTAVENITWANRQTMIDGTYKFYVNDYSGRGAKKGFRAEIEFDGTVYEFDCPPFNSQGQVNIMVAEVTLKNGVFTIKELLESTTSTKELWNVQTQQFVPVSIVMNSPNYWNEQQGIGNKHVFFMLKDCVNSEQPNGFYNEFLKQDLDKHKRVFEALGSKMRVEAVDEQLSGVGFSTTRRNDVVVKVKGQIERVMKIKF